MNIGFNAACDNRVYSTSTLYTKALGGIQTSVTLLARELAKYHNVYVFNPIEDECIDGGVNYLNQDLIGNYADILDAVISVGYEGLSMDPRISKVPRSIFWKHHNEPYIEHMDKFIDRVDTVVFGSRYSMEAYSDHYYSDKYTVIYPPIDIGAIEPLDMDSRKSHLVYISCPNRGQRRFAKILPRVTEAIPDIELHSYGTFQIYGDHWLDSDIEYRDEDEYIELNAMANFYQHGSIPYYDILKVLCESMILAYPCVFIESFGAATAMAMACGTPVVTSNVGATRTLYPGYPYAIEIEDSDLGKAHTDWYADLFTEHVVRLYNNRDEWHRVSEEYRELAARYDVEVIAKEWLDIL